MTITDEQLTQIIQRLEGSCIPLYEAIDSVCPDAEEDDLTQDQFTQIDNIFMRCNSCDWWAETSDTDIVDGDVLCGECRRERGIED